MYIQNADFCLGLVVFHGCGHDFSCHFKPLILQDRHLRHICSLLLFPKYFFEIVYQPLHINRRNINAHNIASWNAFFINLSLILHFSHLFLFFYLYGKAHIEPSNLYQTVCLSSIADGYHTVVIIFLTVVIIRPPLNLLCGPVIGYSLISLQLKLYGRHLHTSSPTKC